MARVRIRKIEKVNLLPYHLTRPVLVKYNISKVEQAARALFNEPVPAA